MQDFSTLNKRGTVLFNENTTGYCGQSLTKFEIQYYIHGSVPVSSIALDIV